MTSVIHIALLTLLALQEPAPAPAPTLRGRVVAEATALPIAGATVLADGFAQHVPPAETDAAGDFTLLTGARCIESNAISNRGADFLRVSAPGFTELRVDPCSEAPWAAPIPLRKSASLRGRFAEGRFDRVLVSARAIDLTWPPQSGLYGEDGGWHAQVDTAGTFEFGALPAQIVLTVAWDGFVDGQRTRHTLPLVLQPGEARDIVLSAPLPDQKSPSTANSAQGAWIPVQLSAVNLGGGSRPMPWFEVIGESRPIRHRVGGGRWHVHGFRACNCLELRTDATRVIARDIEGWVGACDLAFSADGTTARARVVLSRGTLLRLDASGSSEDVRASISVAGVRFVERELLAGVVHYEVVPRGAVLVRVRAVSGAEWETPVDASSSERVHSVLLSR